MLNEESFKAALRAFHKVHANTVDSLRIAIETFRREEIARISDSHKNSPLKIFSADTEHGPDSALIISGFSGLPEIESFLSEAFNAPGK